MINQFIVKANQGKNQLQVILDGIFMKSEVMLATYLIKEESKKLSQGFEALIDLKNFKSDANVKIINSMNFRNILRRLGGGRIKFEGLDYLLQEAEKGTVGFYPYENEWFFR